MGSVYGPVAGKQNLGTTARARRRGRTPAAHRETRAGRPAVPGRPAPRRARRRQRPPSVHHLENLPGRRQLDFHPVGGPSTAPRPSRRTATVSPSTPSRISRVPRRAPSARQAAGASRRSWSDSSRKAKLHHASPRNSKTERPAMAKDSPPTDPSTAEVPVTSFRMVGPEAGFVWITTCASCRPRSES